MKISPKCQTWVNSWTVPMKFIISSGNGVRCFASQKEIRLSWGMYESVFFVA